MAVELCHICKYEVSTVERRSDALFLTEPIGKTTNRVLTVAFMKHGVAICTFLLHPMCLSHFNDSPSFIFGILSEQRKYAAYFPRAIYTYANIIS